MKKNVITLICCCILVFTWLFAFEKFDFSAFFRSQKGESVQTIEDFSDFMSWFSSAKSGVKIENSEKEASTTRIKTIGFNKYLDAENLPEKVTDKYKNATALEELSMKYSISSSTCSSSDGDYQKYTTNAEIELKATAKLIFYQDIFYTDIKARIYVSSFNTRSTDKDTKSRVKTVMDMDYEMIVTSDGMYIRIKNEESVSTHSVDDEKPVCTVSSLELKEYFGKWIYISYEDILGGDEYKNLMPGSDSYNNIINYLYGYLINNPKYFDFSGGVYSLKRSAQKEFFKEYYAYAFKELGTSSSGLNYDKIEGNLVLNLQNPKKPVLFNELRMDDSDSGEETYGGAKGGYYSYEYYYGGFSSATVVFENINSTEFEIPSNMDYITIQDIFNI